MKDPHTVIDWILAYPVPEGGATSPYARYNSVNFLCSLYFNFKWDECDARFMDAIEEKARHLDPLYR